MSCPAGESRQRPLDLVIRNGTVVDGTGQTPFGADIGIAAGRIAAITASGRLTAATEVDAAGLHVTPGFVDIHSHADYALMVDGRAQNFLTQGVTSVVVGNCGHGVAPVSARSRSLVQMNVPACRTCWEIPVTWSDFGSYLEAFRSRGCAVNVFPLVSHGALRLAVAGFAPRDLTAAQLRDMRSMTADALAAGAVGVSSGLEYAPGLAASRAELAFVCEPLGDFGGYYATHVRNRTGRIVAAVEEALAVAEQGGARLQLSHFLRRPWGAEALYREAVARAGTLEAQGLSVGFDVFPFDLGPAPLAYLLPQWVRAGTRAEVADRLSSRRVRDRILADLGDVFAGAIADMTDNAIYLICDGRDGALVGRSLQEIARARRSTVPEAALWVLARAGEDFYCVASLDRWVEWDDLVAALADPRFMIMSDGAAGGRDGALKGYAFHLSDWGYATRFLADFVRDMAICPLPAAIQRMTSKPADQIGLPDRGRLQVGARADLAVFDLAALASRVSTDHPTAASEGIRHVLVNGAFALRDGKLLETRAGTIGLPRP